ncbi:gamma-glutamyltransferase, partial [Acinetobacter baumannii]
IADNIADLARDPGLAALFLRDGQALPAGTRLVQSDYAQSLSLIAETGPAALYGGPLGQALTDFMAAKGGLIGPDDLTAYRVETREPIRG